MSWQQKKLGDIADLLVGFAFKSQHFLDASEGGVRLVRGDNVQQGFLRWGDKAKKWNSAEYEDFRRYQLEKDDVLLAMDRPIVGGGLKLAWVKELDLPCLLVQRVTRIRGAENLARTNFLRYVLSTPEFLGHIESVTTGANIPHISGKDIASFELRLPPLAEQDRIVEILSAYDDLVEANVRRIELLEESARLLYQEWFINLRFPNHQTVKSYEALPRGWSVVTLGDLAFLNYGKALKDSDRRSGEIPVYGSSGVVGFHDQALVGGPGIIVGRKGNVGSVYFSECDFFPIDTVFYVSTEQSSYFVHQLLKTMNFISSDSAVPGLNRNYAHGLQVLKPEERVLVQFEQLVDPIYRQIEILLKANKNTAEARDALLPKLMSGAIQV